MDDVAVRLPPRPSRPSTPTSRTSHACSPNSSVRDIADKPRCPETRLVATMAESDNLEPALAAFARAHLAEVMQIHLLRLRRMLMAEAERFPDLAALGPGRTVLRPAPPRDLVSVVAPAASGRPRSRHRRPALQLARAVDPTEQV